MPSAMPSPAKKRAPPFESWTTTSERLLAAASRTALALLVPTTFTAGSA